MIFESLIEDLWNLIDEKVLRILERAGFAFVELVVPETRVRVGCPTTLGVDKPTFCVVEIPWESLQPRSKYRV